MLSNKTVTYSCLVQLACLLGISNSYAYSGSGEEEEAVNQMLSYPGRETNIITYHIGGKRAFHIRYSKSIDRNSFSATLNGKDVSSAFFPVAGKQQNVYLALDKGENRLTLCISDYGDKETNQPPREDTDEFILWLKPVKAEVRLSNSVPPGLGIKQKTHEELQKEIRNHPPGNQPSLIDRSRP